MKISQLPEEVKIKALEYQKNSDWQNPTDHLMHDFNWADTEEGSDYWQYWDEKEFIELIKTMYSEEEMFKLINEYSNDVFMSGCKLRAEEWFNKYKKK